MGKGRRRRKQRKANANQWRTYIEDEQQEQTLDTQRQRELHFTCINLSPHSTISTALSNLEQFCSSIGPVTARFQVNGNSSKSRNGTAATAAANRSTAIEAVVEMATAAHAQQILQMRRQVLLFDRNQGRGVLQLALPASFGLLRSSSCYSCGGRIGRSCGCQRYCK
jgi:hypothetical protein